MCTELEAGFFLRLPLDSRQTKFKRPQAAGHRTSAHFHITTDKNRIRGQVSGKLLSAPCGAYQRLSFFQIHTLTGVTTAVDRRSLAGLEWAPVQATEKLDAIVQTTFESRWIGLPVTMNCI